MAQDPGFIDPATLQLPPDQSALARALRNRLQSGGPQILGEDNARWGQAALDAAQLGTNAPADQRRLFGALYGLTPEEFAIRQANRRAGR